MADVLIIETGNGGDIVLNGNDIVTIEGFFNMPYIGMFGGNIEASTVQNQDITTGSQLFDWWGNSVLIFNQPEAQYNSILEKTLNHIAVASSSREVIKRAVLEDLEFMQNFAEISVEVSIVGIDRILILINIQRPDNLQSNEFTYIWNASEAELTIGNITGIEYGNGIALNNLLNFGL